MTEHDHFEIAADVTITENDHLVLHVKKADNQVVAWIDQTWLLSVKTENDIPVDKSALVNHSSLQKGDHYLSVVGINWGGPAHYEFFLSKNGNRIDSTYRNQRDRHELGYCGGLVYRIKFV